MIVEVPQLPIGFEKGNLIIEHVRVTKYSGILSSEGFQPQNVIFAYLEFISLCPSTDSLEYRTGSCKGGIDCVFLIMIFWTTVLRGISLFMDELFKIGMFKIPER